jgi:hypothetical protein
MHSHFYDSTVALLEVVVVVVADVVVVVVRVGGHSVSAIHNLLMHAFRCRTTIHDHSCDDSKDPLVKYMPFSTTRKYDYLM